ncbi:hypothetical protein M011DRAFT_416287 [Sporormia fimetaria CBS 119925]|uniref:Nuclear pore complex protein Nup85 n=1 Tax=Sporormia fimetaria CBS 119925 TaxID=1340428 RepID=A0A6A6VMQ4_9PLEO|nr:hypothetical protein M011DRAFT_416287 [Sporormia fimetaria CBS 119925]
MFRVPTNSSTPPSSPGRNDPSTTPAGPPPGDSYSYYASSTPAQPPPRFQLGNANPRSFNPRRQGPNNSPPRNGVGSGLFGSPAPRGADQRGRSTNAFGFRSSPPRHGDDMYGEDMDQDGEEEGEEEDALDDLFSGARPRSNYRFSQSAASRNSFADDSLNRAIVDPAAKQTQYDLPTLTESLAPHVDRVKLKEPDDAILETERLLEKLQEQLESSGPSDREEVLATVSQDLISTWRDTASTGAFYHAQQLASLLLAIRHPPARAERQSALTLLSARSRPKQYTPIPRVLLDWLNDNNEAIAEIEAVLSERDGYSAHEAFWDAVAATALRGNFADVLKLLRGANFTVAETAVVDGLGESGYKGDHLFNTNEVITAAIGVIEECPAVTSDDWDVKSNGWSIWRQRVQLAFRELQEFAEGDNQNRHSLSQQFQAPNFGLSQSQNSFNLSVASRKAESRVPWSIYENLTRLYKQLLGNEEEIMSIAADWVEAVVALTVWWDGEDERAPPGSFAASRRSLARSQRVRDVDVTPVQAYAQRLSASLAPVFDSGEEDLSLNTTDRYEVGLACIFDQNIEGVLRILRSWSIVVAAAVTEVARGGDWLPRSAGLLDQFDDSDLMVLSYNDDERNQRKGITKDELLLAYANELASKEVIRSTDGQTVREGWEMAARVLGRFDDVHQADKRIEEILSKLQLVSSERVDTIIQLCHNMGMAKQAETIALTYADHLRTNTQNHGDTLLYYARAHEAAKLQDVLRKLVAHCLVKSIAWPPLNELDDTLKSLITSPKQTLTTLAGLDQDAAHLLSTNLSGYATIRKFYDLRDEAIVSPGKSPAHRPLARKTAAADALMVIILSAASSIRGGLYDPEVETVVQVDVLLPLLGEALLFVNQPKRTLTLQHLYALLAAVEDLDTAPSMIRAQCEEVLSKTLATAHDSNAPSARSHLQKSTSNFTTASSQYSLIGSADFGSVEGQSIENSTVYIQGGQVDDSKRAWDWRKGFNKNATGSDVIRLLRLGIARETARAFVEGQI